MRCSIVCLNPRNALSPGRPKKYGDRLNIRRLRYKVVSIMEKDYQVASQVVRTKMCPADVLSRCDTNKTADVQNRIGISCVFTTDLTLEIPQIVEYYRQRWQIETAFRDANTTFRLQRVSGEISEKHQSFPPVEFRRSEFDEVDLLSARNDRETPQC